MPRANLTDTAPAARGTTPLGPVRGTPAQGAPSQASHASTRIIPDRAEFIDALNSLNRGHVLVRTSDHALGCILDGAFVHHSFRTLVDYRLIAPYDNPFGFPGVEYYRITERGRRFAARAWAYWRSLPIWERLVVRLVG
ncbi:MAG: hypothetical protein AB7P21_11425 [Lautropia sp.]